MTGPPTLSQIRDWDTEHLVVAAEFWDSEARNWERQFTALFEAMARPGGQPWDGDAADQAQLQAYLDRMRVIGVADELSAVAAAARTGASGLRAAKRAVLDIVEEATAAGFEVDEQLTVSDPRYLPAPLVAARQTQAVAYAARLRTAAASLTALDQDVAAKVLAATNAVDVADFGEGNGAGSAVSAPTASAPVKPAEPPAEEAKQQPRLEDLIPTESDWIMTGANTVSGAATDGTARATIAAITDAPGAAKPDTRLLTWLEDPKVQGFSRVNRIVGVAGALPGVFADMGEGDPWQKAVTREGVGTAAGLWAGGAAGGWLSGAALGGELGSVIPGAGTAIGVIVGAAVGAAFSMGASKLTGEAWDGLAKAFG